MDLALLPARQAAERLAELLERADPALDASAVAAMRDRSEGDAVLGALPLPAFAGLLERLARANGPDARETAWAALDLVRRPALLRRIPAGEVERWAGRILALLEASDYTVGVLFRERAQRYGSKTLFELPGPLGTRGLSWRQTAVRVEQLARGLFALGAGQPPGPVALLAENRLELALSDLACLSSGILDVMIPANATDEQVVYMLRHARASTLLLSGRPQLRALLPEAAPELRWIVSFDPLPGGGRGALLDLDALLARGEQVAAGLPAERGAAVRLGDRATVMYTSGTTGMPKGIPFTHRNIVFKRFARALALPELGEEDVFLCLLPLYHTFGRYLEMLGCVFWGATYCFLDNPSLEALVQGMRRHRPTVFINVPKKWMQLSETIAQGADIGAGDAGQFRAATLQNTGGRLRWGLSAAGHLDAEVFRFFQRQGVELMSGFGMTEATGGITMTRPGRYRADSLGGALPGIELRLAEDGELLIRGPYVVSGYLDPPEDSDEFDADGWLHTGDLVEMSADGEIRLIDRKKEIYKNIKGETIAPQRIENLFRDFESVGRVFLVGDQLEYNTLLIWPSPQAQAAQLDPSEHFRSLVVSVNKFLAPYERIVDFALLPRDLDTEHGELTPKGTPRRKTVVRNFAELIGSRYRRTHLSVGGVELIFPNWLFQLLGLTAQDLRVGEFSLELPSAGKRLTVKRWADGTAQVGSCRYLAHGPLDLGALLSSPRLWLGNEELVDFVPLEAAARQRPGRTELGIEWRRRAAPFAATDELQERLLAITLRGEWELGDLDLAARLLGSADELAALDAVELLEQVLAKGEGPLAEPARQVLGRAADSDSPAVHRRALQVLFLAEKEPRLGETLQRFLRRSPAVLDGEMRAVLTERNLSETRLDALIAAAQEHVFGEPADAGGERIAVALMRLLADYGAVHPVQYARIRAFLVRGVLFARNPALRTSAAEAAAAMQAGFRRWLGATPEFAVDPETSEEYRWADVVVFDDDVPEPDRRRLLAAIRETAFLREAVFAFSQGTLLRLADIPPGGVWIRLLGSRHGKSVYRVTVQTRYQGAHDLAANVNHELSPQQIEEELHWLILSGAPGKRDPLVEEFGGYWPEFDLWSEEFIPGETLDRVLRRLSAHPQQLERLGELWPFLALAALSAYVDFWNRSGRVWEIADPSLSNVVVPTEDYHTGTRIVSLSARRPHSGLGGMIRAFREEFVAPAERQYAALAGRVGWRAIFSSIPEVVGEEEGLALLQATLDDASAGLPAEAREPLEEFIATVRERGFLPARLFFAARRYQRWEALSPEATHQARARTMQELYDTYGLQRLAPSYPEARVRFFRETVFRNCPAELAAGLERLIAELRGRAFAPDALIDAVADLRGRIQLGPDEDYFLARLSFPYLRPEDAASFASSELAGKHRSDVVVVLADADGSPFQVRHALNPREVERLHRLFLAATLDVRFGPEHHYMVALSDRGQLIAGIYYAIEEEGRSAHLEKIVVAEPYRRRGVADGLMQEFFNRLRAMGVKTVTTGFFRPEYFYGYGFRIEKRYAGLVKSLEEPAPAPGAA
ncbi:MAG TPA: GNAT family N-acetyltransferase [Candidatus Polarisedimenticolaceae bacterium]|nr:GNAT family N-acetyltransferase [Candidatus Polarisedimenticolaceae bacterium]